MAKATFKKAERLSKEKYIQELFDRGSSFNLFPFKVFFLPHPEEGHRFNQVLITVPSRVFKKAVDRNAIKRRIREGYRLQKHNMPPTPKLLIAYIYIAKEIHPSDFIHDKLIQSFKRIYNS